jgi:hypothetical protein
MAKNVKKKLEDQHKEVFKSDDKRGDVDPSPDLPTEDGVKPAELKEVPGVNKGEDGYEDHAEDEMALQREIYEAIMRVEQKLTSVADALMATNEANKADPDEDEEDANKAEPDEGDEDPTDGNKSFGMDDVKSFVSKSMGSMEKRMMAQLKKMTGEAAPAKAITVSKNDPEAPKPWMQLALKSMNDGKITGTQFAAITNHLNTNPQWQPDEELSKAIQG